MSEASDDERPWQDDAECRDAPTPWFFLTPPSGHQTGPARREYDRRLDRALTMCSECPVVDECKAYARAHQIEHGIWGGVNLTELGYRDLRRFWATGVAA